MPTLRSLRSARPGLADGEEENADGEEASCSWSRTRGTRESTPNVWSPITGGFIEGRRAR